MNTITCDTAAAFIRVASGLMEENKDYLYQLDAALGDGDLGLTMTAGFGKAAEEAGKSTETDLGKFFMLIGMTFAKAVPSTMGTLVASGFMKAAKGLKGRTELDTAGFAEFAETFVTGIMERGKANPGDRTIIDSLDPAAKAVRAAADGGKGLAEAAEAAVAAANQGLEATKDMVAAFGRGVFFGEKVLGTVDQGAVVGTLIYEAWRKTLA